MWDQGGERLPILGDAYGCGYTCGRDASSRSPNDVLRGTDLVLYSYLPFLSRKI